MLLLTLLLKITRQYGREICDTNYWCQAMCTRANSTLTKNVFYLFYGVFDLWSGLVSSFYFQSKILLSVFCLGESTILSKLKLVVFVYFLPLQRMMRMEQKIGGRLMSSIESVSFSVTSKQGLNISVKDLAGWQLNKASPLVLPKTCHLLSWTNRPLNLCYSLNSYLCSSVPFFYLFLFLSFRQKKWEDRCRKLLSRSYFVAFASSR